MRKRQLVVFVLALIGTLFVAVGCDPGIGGDPTGGSGDNPDDGADGDGEGGDEIPPPNYTFVINDDEEFTDSREVVLHADVEGAVTMRISNRPFEDDGGATLAREINQIDPSIIAQIDPTLLSPEFEALVTKYPTLTNTDLVGTLNDDTEAISTIDSVITAYPAVVDALNADAAIVNVITDHPVVAPALITSNPAYADVLKANPGVVTESQKDDGSTSAVVNIRDVVSEAESLEYARVEAFDPDKVAGIDLSAYVIYDIDEDAVDPVPFNGEGSATTGWLPYAAYKDWMLIAGNTNRAVYAQFRDAEGNVIHDARDQIQLEADYTDALVDYFDGMRIVPERADLPVDDPQPTGEPTEAPNSGDGMYCTITPYSARAEFNENICLNPASGVIFPGSILDAESITSGAYRSIQVPRGGGTVYTPDIRNIDTVRVDVNRVSEANVQEQIAHLLQQEMTGSVPNQGVTFEVIDAYDEDSLTIALGAEFKYAGASVKSSFDYENTDVNTRLLIRFVQHYYTINFETPLTPAELFADGTLPTDLDAVLDPGMVPVYVASVKYGRMGYYSFESTMHKQEVGVALEAQYNAGPVGAGIDLSVVVGEITSETTTKGQIFGGNAASAAGAAVDLEEFYNWIANDTTSVGSLADVGAVPISYQLNYLSDNEIAKLSLYSEYNIRNCTAIDNQFTVGDFRIELISVDERDKDLYGDIFVAGWEDADGDGTFAEVTADNSTEGDSQVLQLLRPDTIDLQTAKNQGISTFPLSEPDPTSGEAAGFPNLAIPAKDMEFTFQENMLSNPYIRVKAEFREKDDNGDEYFGQKYRTAYPNGDIAGDFVVGPFESKGTKFNLLFRVWPTEPSRGVTD